MKRKIIALTMAMVLGTASVSFAASTTSTDSQAAATGTATVYTAAVSSTTAAEKYADATSIVLSDSKVTVDGETAGTDDSAAVYTSNDIIYYEDRDTYDSGNTYGEGTDSDKHSESEADAHTIVNITKAGTYIISGTLTQGQIAVDLGDDAETDPDAVVTLIFNGADITCTVAPAVIFYNVYECNSEWVAYDNGETTEYNATSDVDTTAAGANVIIADGSVNNITGSHVAKVYKDKAEQKKKYKYDGAFYSCMSMNIDGGDEDTGILNIIADNEGLDSEMHLTINGGRVYIQSQDDGINTNEDGVSVTTINGGELHIVAGLGSEGDGVDSNGYLVINGGTVIAIAKPASDSGLDSDMGSYINGGYVVATGSTMDWAESDSEQVTMNLQFASAQGADEAIIVTDTDGNVIFAYDPEKDETTGSYNRGYQGAVISCPEFEVGETYYVYVGGDVEGTDVNGLYDASTVTGFSGATRQEYTGTDVQGGPGGPGGGMPGGGDFSGEPPEMPDGTTSGAIDGMTPPDMPSGTTSGGAFGGMTPPDMNGGSTSGGAIGGMTRPQMPGGTTSGGAIGGMTPPDMNGSTTSGGAIGGMTPPDMNGSTTSGSAIGGMTPPSGNGQSSTSSGEASVKFYMNDKVNAFSGVTDENTSSTSGSTGSTGNTGDTGSTPSSGTTPAASGSSEGSGALGFSDISKDSWYYTGVEYAINNKLFNGTSTDKFEPNANMTRGMLWTVLARLSGQELDSATGSKWYSAGQDWAKDNNISDGTLPDSSITREQLVTMLYRYLGTGSSVDTDSTLAGYKDASKVSSYAREAMAWAVSNGIITGTDATTLSPGSTATRAQVAAIIQRYSAL